MRMVVQTDQAQCLKDRSEVFTYNSIHKYPGFTRLDIIFRRNKSGQRNRDITQGKNEEIKDHHHKVPL